MDNSKIEMTPMLVSQQVDGYSGPVFTFCHKNDLRNVQELYESDPGVVSRKYGKLKNTLLHLAASFNRGKIIKFLLEKGSVQTADRNGNTPLHIACIRGSLETLQPLLQDPIYLNTENIDGDLPIHVAAASGNLKAVRLLIEGGVFHSCLSQTGDTPLHAAAQFGHTDVIKYLIQLGADTNSRNKKGETPLHLAAGANVVQNKYMHVKMLLEANAHIEARTKSGVPVSFYAARTGGVCVFKLLLDEGSPVRKVKVVGENYVEETSGDTLLRIAISSGCTAKETVILDKIMEARYKVNSAINISELCYGRRSCLLKTEVTEQDIALSEMYSEIIHNAEEANSIFRSLLDSHSSVLENLFDKCLMTDRQSAVIHGRVQYDFFLFGDADCEMSILDLIIESGKLSLLGHPLIETFIELKWFRAWKMFSFFMAIFCLKMFALAAYVLLEHGNVYGGPEESKEKARKISWIVLLVMNCIVSLLIALKTFGFLIVRIKEKWSAGKYSLRNVAEASVRINLLKEVMDPILCFVVLFTGSKEASCILILISALQFMMNVSRIPRIGSHVFITGKVFRTIFEFFMSYMFVIMGYAIAFHISLPQEAAFKNLGDSFIKVLTMLLGEFDYVDHIAENHTGWMTRIVFILFLLTMSIVLMNLVVGLAIGDIENMRKNAEIHKLISTMIAIRQVDDLCSFLRRISGNIFFMRRVVCDNVVGFKQMVILSLDERNYCKANRITIKNESQGKELTYTCSRSVAKKVTKIIHDRLYVECNDTGVVTEETVERLLHKIENLEEKINQMNKPAPLESKL